MAIYYRAGYWKLVLLLIASSFSTGRIGSKIERLRRGKRELELNIMAQSFLSSGDQGRPSSNFTMTWLQMRYMRVHACRCI